VVKSQCKGVLEENPHKSSKSDQITQDKSYYEGNLKSKEPTMMIQFARINYPIKVNYTTTWKAKQRQWMNYMVIVQILLGCF
jgi:hypothetical protein